MPLTRPTTIEEDVMLSLSTTISGLLTKYASNSDAKPVLASIVANVMLGINAMIDKSDMPITAKTAFREELRDICRKALRPSLGIVDSNGGTINAANLDPKEPA